LAKQHVSLEKFVIEHDAEVYGKNLLRPQQHDGRSPIQELEKLAHLRIDNPFLTVPEFQAHLESVDLLNVERLRPHWDTYFMVSAYQEWEPLTTIV
jgi:dCMP deaminase